MNEKKEFEEFKESEEFKNESDQRTQTAKVRWKRSNVLSCVREYCGRRSVSRFATRISLYSLNSLNSLQ
jgi:hypothetical protein